MPTGYTAKLMEQGQTFQEFALQCARAFGACITLKDDPMDVPIPESFEPTEYHVKSLREARAELRRLEAMTNQERITFGTQTRDDSLERYRGYLETERIQNARLSEMEKLVQAWTPPTPDHQGLKDFMLQQIETSKRNGDFYEKEIAKLEETAPYEFYAKAVEATRRTIEYSLTKQSEEQARVAGRNNWIKKLRESLP